MKKMYLIEGKKWLKELGKKGFTWERGRSLLGSGESIFEEGMNNRTLCVYVIDFDKKTVSCFPLEIYAPQSPMADNKKYQYYLSKCGDWNDLMREITKTKEDKK